MNLKIRPDIAKSGISSIDPMIRTEIKKLSEIPNIGAAMIRDLSLLGISRPAELIGRDPYRMYEALCTVTGRRHDPCVIDVFVPAVRFMEGAPPPKWWACTEERKRTLAQKTHP